VRDKVVQPRWEGTVAYVLEGYKFGTGGYGTSGGVVTWSFATGNFGDEPYSYTSFLTGQFQTEIRAALAAFEAVANIDFVEVTDSSASMLRFGFVNDFPAFPWSPAIAGGPGGVAGQATVRFADNAAPVIHLAEADIAFDAKETWQVVNGNILTGPGGTRFFSIALHEIGHAIGLDHHVTAGERSIMKASLDPTYNGLEAIDIQALQAIYGAPAAQPAGSVSIGDVTITEGNAGTKVATFVVTRAGGSAAFNVNYATANNTATAGSDYQAASGTLSFGAGETSKTISIVISGDTVVESAEKFFVNLSGATNGATIADGQGVGTISNDDTPPVASDDFADSLSDTTAPIGQLAINTPRSGNIETGGDGDLFRVDLVAGTVYNLRLQGLDTGSGTLYDPYLRLFSSTGQQLAFDDDSGVGRESLIVFKATTTGTHYLGGAAYASTQTGTYNMSVSTAQIRTGNANDNTFLADAHAEAFKGLAGSDTVSYQNATYGVVASLLNPLQNTGFAWGDSYNSIENLRGSSFADTLTGNSLNNVISGRAGADIMAGKGGNDRYYVDNAGDVVIEAKGAGNDRVISTVSFNMAGQHIERLTLDGTGKINGIGNSLSNSITGNSASNVLNGKTGNDTLTGGGAGDFFVFNTALNATSNVDTITDFQVNIDKIRMDDAIFAQVGTSLTASEFVANKSGTATSSAHNILYDTTDGRLFYDPDGTGAAARVHFATLKAGLALDHLDFVVI
jgi:hypothetical protein